MLCKKQMLSKKQLLSKIYFLEYSYTMSTNAPRYSYVKYTGKPYMYYHGTTYEDVPIINSDRSNQDDTRTIIRSKQCDNIILSKVPLNGMNNVFVINE